MFAGLRLERTSALFLPLQTLSGHALLTVGDGSGFLTQDTRTAQLVAYRSVSFYPVQLIHFKAEMF